MWIQARLLKGLYDQSFGLVDQRTSERAFWLVVRCVKSLAIGSVPRAPTMGGRLHCGLEVYTQSALSRDKGNRAGPTATNSAQTHKYHKFHKHRLRTVTVAQPMVALAP